MRALDLHVEHELLGNVHALRGADVRGELALLLQLDGVEEHGKLIAHVLAQIADAVKITQEALADLGADELGELRVAETEPAARRDTVRNVHDAAGVFLVPRAEEIVPEDLAVDLRNAVHLAGHIHRKVGHARLIIADDVEIRAGELLLQALPLVEYRLRYVLSHTNYDTLDGKVKALHEMMPVLAGIHESAVRSEYERKLAQALMLDEGIVREELRHYRPEAEEAPARQPIRQAIAKPDTALRKAGRLVIRMAWQDAAIIAHLETIVPLAGIRDPVQREILTFLKESAEEGRPVDDMSAASLSDEAAAELSRSLVEDLGGRDETGAYDDSLRVLRKAYLNALYTEHSRKANEYAQNGQHEACLQELNEVNKIKHEMDEW